MTGSLLVIGPSEARSASRPSLKKRKERAKRRGIVVAQQEMLTAISFTCRSRENDGGMVGGFEGLFPFSISMLNASQGG